MAYGTASVSATRSTSRSRTSCPSVSRRVSRRGSPAYSTPSGPTSPPPRRSVLGSTPSESSTRERQDCPLRRSRGLHEPMTIAAHRQSQAQEGLRPAFAAIRVRLGLVALLLVTAGLCWWLTFDEMRQMDDGPWTSLGTLTWFVGVWIVMMAAMMFPSVAPTVALYSRMTRKRWTLAPLAFALGYLLAWAGVGVLAFTIAAGFGEAFTNVLAWDRAGRWVAAATLLGAAAYELTPLKDVCLGKCRSPLGFLLTTWREGPTGSLNM